MRIITNDWHIFEECRNSCLYDFMSNVHKMPSKQHLGLTDYAVLGISLFIPVVTGLFFKLYKGQRHSLQLYLLAGKNASMIPVVMSISVTVMSAIIMIGYPAEIYKFGPQYTLMAFSTVIGMFLSSRVFLPVYFRCNVTSIYEVKKIFIANILLKGFSIYK